ncbi:retrovirus-related pol polyprotein from transposon, partial [Lasius niger]
MSHELRAFLTSQGVATSRTTLYNPRRNGQVERYNGIILKTIMLALKSNNMKTEHWEEVLGFALHSIRPLLCTATNVTPHERMFNHPRRSFNGSSSPTWLTKTGPILMKKYVRTNKHDSLVEEVELIEANPEYAYVRLPDGRETT